jgi:hypothetical protein
MKIVLTSAVLCVAAAATGQTIQIGGNSNTHLKDALNALGYAYTDVSPAFPAPGAADILIVGEDGGSAPGYDYTNFLNGGGDVIFTGGSGLQEWSDWTAGYFNNSYTGWHTDGGWTTSANIPASQFMPGTYTPGDTSQTYHMMHFNATQDTTLYGKNGESADVAAFRTYANGGSFNYMALDLGPYGTQDDINNFTIPFMKSALQAAVPAPGAAGILGLAGLGALRRRR